MAPKTAATRAALICFSFSFFFLPACVDADYDHDRYGYNDRRNDGYGTWGSGERDRYRNDNRYDGDRRCGSDRDRRYGNNNNNNLRQGTRSGELTPNEVRDLQRDQRDIDRERSKAAADGVITRHEQNEIRDEVRDYNENLRHNLNDGERR